MPILVVAQVSVSACVRKNDAFTPEVEPVYDTTTGALTRAAEDTDGDGRVDKWETYRDSRLVVVAFDTIHRGTPDRRIVYDADANGRVEIDRKGTGHFVSSLTVQNAAEASVVGKSP